jgi:hypothetical protein
MSPDHEPRALRELLERFRLAGALAAAGRPWTIRASEGRHSQLPWNLSSEAVHPVASPGRRLRTAPQRRPSQPGGARPVGGART